MIPGHFVFLDLETTGTNPVRDRVIEVGLCEVADGEIVDEWSTLVNPQVPISAFIERYTGIGNGLVAAAPSFGDITEELYRRLAGRILVAHNARFDYGFLKNEFRRQEITYQAKTLCTLKLSRRLFPQERRHGLDALIARHGLTPQPRHRALGDVRMTLEFFRKACAEVSPEIFGAAVGKILQQPSLPSQLPPEQVAALPNRPGVYLFYGENDAVLYVGKSADLRTRVLSHFSGDHSRGKELKLSRQARRIDWVETAGELGALLLESRLVKELAPVHNRRLRRSRALQTIRMAVHGSRLEIVPLRHLERDDLAHLYGVFRTARAADQALRAIVAEHGLCPQVMGLEKGRGACFGYQIKKCRGACVGEEPLALHRARLEAALAGLRLRSWPFAGPVGLRERSDSGRCDLHVLDAWCHLGTARAEGDLEEILETSSPLPFDHDSYKILTRYLDAKGGNVEIIPLTPRSAG